MLKRVAQGIDPATGIYCAMEKRAFIVRGEDLEPLKGFPEQLHDVNVVVFDLGSLAAPDRLGRSQDRHGDPDPPRSLGFFRRGQTNGIISRTCPIRPIGPASGFWIATERSSTSRFPVRTRPAANILMLSVADLFLEIKGKPNAGALVEYLSFKGLTFCYSRYLLPPQGHGDDQAAMSIPAVIMADNARHLTLTDCRIEHTGDYGVWFRHGCTDCPHRTPRPDRS